VAKARAGMASSAVNHSQRLPSPVNAEASAAGTSGQTNTGAAPGAAICTATPNTKPAASMPDQAPRLVGISRNQTTATTP